MILNTHGCRLPILTDGAWGTLLRSAEALASAGANFIGGCCGTSPEFIRALKDEVLR